MKNKKILYDGDCFIKIASESLLEDEFEQIIKNNAEQIFADWHVVPFNCKVESSNPSYGPKIPDLALIDNYYRSWWVVEVEMSHHSLHGHVIPQVEVFSEGKYGLSHIKHLLSKSNELDLQKSTYLVTTTQPRVLIIVNEPRDLWYKSIDVARICSATIFRNKKGRYLIELDGDIPELPKNLVSLCYRYKSIPSCLKVIDSGMLSKNKSKLIEVMTHKGLSVWELFFNIEECYLISRTRFNFEDVNEFYLLEDATNERYELKPIKMFKKRSLG